MARWSEIERDVPDLAVDVRGFMEAGAHKALATLRADGAPRVSATEAIFLGGDLWLGSMWRSPKARDLQRDPRFALHSASADPAAWVGDAKVAGSMVEIDDDIAKQRLLEARGGGPPGPFHLFRAEICELVVIRLGQPEDHLVVRRWTPEGGERRSELR
jgi:hypothetical protein